MSELETTFTWRGLTFTLDREEATPNVYKSGRWLAWLDPQPNAHYWHCAWVYDEVSRICGYGHVTKEGALESCLQNLVDQQDELQGHIHTTRRLLDRFVEQKSALTNDLVQVVSHKPMRLP